MEELELQRREKKTVTLINKAGKEKLPNPCNFGMLFKDGKKIAWLQNGFKICCA